MRMALTTQPAQEMRASKDGALALALAVEIPRAVAKLVALAHMEKNLIIRSQLASQLTSTLALAVTVELPGKREQMAKTHP
jgi:hypothetical protein